MRDLYRDARRAVLAILAGFLLYFVFWGGLPFGLGFLTGRATSPKVEALRDTIRITDSVIVDREKIVTRWKARVDTVHAASDSLDALVTIRDDSTVLVRDSAQTGIRPVVIPTSVVANIAALRLTVATQDTLILSLYRRDSTQQWRIETRDKLIAELSKPKCGRRCGFLLGVGASVLVYKAVK